jgi:hypothetical protein
MIWTLYWALFELCTSNLPPSGWFYYISWILDPSMMCMSPLCSKSSISETPGDSWSSNTQLILANIENSYLFERKYSQISNIRVFAGYSRVLCNHTRVNVSINLATCVNIYSWGALVVWKLETTGPKNNSSCLTQPLGSFPMSSVTHAQEYKCLGLLDLLLSFCALKSEGAEYRRTTVCKARE